MKIGRVKVVVYRRRSEKRIKGRSSLMVINSTMKERTLQGVGIIVYKDLKEKIVKVKRLGENIIAIELVLEEDIMHLIGVKTRYGSRARARTFHGARLTS